MNNQKLSDKVRSAMYSQCKARGYAVPVDVLMDIGVLTDEKYKDWRFGRVDYLERICGTNLHKLSFIMLEVFFDYICPYCYRGHKNLLKLLEKYTQIEIIWRPCESHPRPEPYWIHSDMAIQGMYYIEEHQGDLWEYHRLVYEALFEKDMDISSVDILAVLAGRCGVNSEDFKHYIAADYYSRQVKDGNRYAWGEMGLDAVPSYCSGKHFIGSKDGFLVPAQKLEHFLKEILKY